MGGKNRPQDLCFTGFHHRVVQTWDLNSWGWAPAFGPVAVAAQALFTFCPRAESPPQLLLIPAWCSQLWLCHCPSLQVRRCRWDRAPQTAYGKLLSSSPGHLSINGILLIPLSFVLKSLGLPRHWLINYEMVLRALVRCATVLDHSFL